MMSVPHLNPNSLVSFLDAADADTVEIGVDGARVQLRAGDLTIGVIPLPIGDRPDLVEMPKGHNGPPITLAEGVLHWLFGLTLPFASTEETRYYLNGVAFEVKDDMLKAVATDGHRFGHRETSAPGAPDMHPRILPRFVAKTLARFTKGREAEVTFDETRARIVLPGCVTVTAKLIDGTFPDWRRVVPKSHDASAEVEAFRLAKFFRATKGLRRERGRAFKIEIEGGEAVARLDSPDLGGASLPLSAKVDDADCVRGMNADYAEGIVRALGGRKVRFELSRGDTGSPMTIRNPEGVPGEFVVLMPMRV